jgi:translin
MVNYLYHRKDFIPMPQDIETIGQIAIDHLTLKHTAREQALPKSRTAIRYCANSIRAVHRHEYGRAEELRAQAATLIAEMAFDLRDHQDIYYAGFVQDAQKEYAEAVAFAALAQHRPLPTPEKLAIGYAPYLNGLAEAIGEMRRYVLDQLRRGNFTDSETYLSYMDDIYALLTSIDFPDAITSGLRRSTDSARGILEKTRGDLTAAISQAQLQQSMQQLQQELQRYQSSQ